MGAERTALEGGGEGVTIGWMHDLIDKVSLEMAQRVARRLRSDPQLINVARKNLANWMERNGDTPSLMRCYREWESILHRTLEEVCQVLCEESEEGQRLRRNSPFAGVLSPEEVWQIKREGRRSDSTPA